MGPSGRPRPQWRSWQSLPSALLALILLTGLLGCEASNGATLPKSKADLVQDAKNAFFKLNLEAARKGFELALSETSLTASERAESARRLANISWRFDRNWTAAEAYLQQAEKLEQSFDTAYERVRLLLSRGRLAEALDAARGASSSASTRRDEILAETEMGRIFLLRLRAAQPDSPQRRREARAALDRLLPIVLGDPGRLEPARIALSLALLLDDGRSALAVWRACYQVPAALTASPASPGRIDTWDYPSLTEAHAFLSRHLPDWAGPSAPPDLRSAVVEALADSKFFSVAAWTATDPRIPPQARIEDRPAVIDVVSYHGFLEKVESLTVDLYRQRALGRTVTHQLDTALKSAARQLWARLHFAGERPAFREKRYWEEISRRFGAQVYFRTDGGGHAVHLGHRVVDDRRKVEQYGRSTDFRFVVIDALPTNGYSSWFWDGAAATGGWVADDGTVVQVRTSYSEGPLEAWNRLTDPRERDEFEKEVRDKTSQDNAIARRNPHAYLPGLALRLRAQAHQRLYSQLRSKGLKESELKNAFVVELGRRARASSIFAHEGRHALERQNVPRNWFRSGDEKEFLAKLSEVAFAPDPRIALVGGILSANIGDGSSHGQANQRIMKGIVAWMKEHASEIQGLDSTRPYLPQLDLLRDEQIRNVFRSLDSWAR